MDTWVIGLIALCAVGVAVILFGALHDRRKNKARAAAMLAPPQRDIPSFTPENRAPQYLSELMARRPPASPAEALSARERTSIAATLQAETTTSIEVGYASKDFVTDRESGWAVLDAPRILVCAEVPGSIRELITVLEKVALTGTPLVIAAPSLSRSVLETLEVNVIQQRMRVLAVSTTDPAMIDSIAARTGARLVSRIDLQASYVTDAHLGRCGRWVADASTSWIVD